jgi:hypothetical protein
MSDESQSNSASASPPDVSVDVQDPLPESNWFYRRVYIYILTLIAIWFVWFAFDSLWQMRHADHLHDLGWWMVILLLTFATYYMVAPSAEQIVRIVQAARILKLGGTTTKESSAETAQGRATTRTTTTGAPATVEPVAPSGGAPRGIDDTPEDAPWPK